jgi:hypothetical protein
MVAFNPIAYPLLCLVLSCSGLVGLALMVVAPLVLMLPLLKPW